MTNSLERPTAEREKPPQLEILSRWPNVAEALRENRVFESLAPELKMPPEVFASPEMIQAMDSHIQRKISELNSALVDLGMADYKLTDESLQSPIAVMTYLTPLAFELMKIEQQANQSDARPEEEKSKEVLDGVSEQFQFSGLGDLVAEARITGQPEQYRQEGDGTEAEKLELGDRAEAAARRKVLIDMYVQGKALNQFGHMYSYWAGKSKEQSAPYRALADCLQILNTATVFSMSEQQGGALSETENNQMESGIVRLGRVEVSKNQEGKFQIYSWGMTAAELSQEVSKGLLEYSVLDTSLPSEGDLTEEEAIRLKHYLEQKKIEALEFVYGEPLAKEVDQSVGKWLIDIRSQHPSTRGETVTRLAKTLRVKEQDVLSGEKDRNLSLRLFKIISALPEEKLTEFYQYALKGNLPAEYWKQL